MTLRAVAIVARKHEVKRLRHTTRNDMVNLKPNTRLFGSTILTSFIVSIGNLDFSFWRNGSPVVRPFWETVNETIYFRPEITHCWGPPVHKLLQPEYLKRGKWLTSEQTSRLSCCHSQCREGLRTGCQPRKRDRIGLSFFQRLSGANCFLFHLSHRSSFLNFIRLSGFGLSD